MKHLFASIFFTSLFSTVIAQELSVTIDRTNGDTTISTGFDTLHFAITDANDSIPDRVVGARTSHNGTRTYWLFFYFSPTDIKATELTITSKNFAYLQKENDEYIRIPYKGRQASYTSKDNAGFFLDITDYLDELRNSNIKLLRFETSELFQEISLPMEKWSVISEIVNRLITA